MFRVKICGITCLDDALAAADAGADAIGLNFYSGSPRFIALEPAREIAAAVPAGVASVGVFVDTAPEEIRRLFTAVPLDWVQLHGEYTVEEIDSLADLPFLLAMRPLSPDLSDLRDRLNQLEARGLTPPVLLDAHSPDRFGGTGKSLDWRAVGAHRRVLGASPLVLAGGLKPANVGEAIRLTRCIAVDTASGVEVAPGVKDHAAIRAFTSAALAAWTCGGP